MIQGVIRGFAACWGHRRSAAATPLPMTFTLIAGPCVIESSSLSLEIAERVKAILRRSRGASATPEDGDKKPIVRGRLTLDPNRHACQWDGKIVRLTVTEFLILQALAQRPGYVKSRDQLMDAAYDDQVYVDDRTIDSHIKRLRKKFRDLDDNFDGIETLYGVGYRYKEA